MTRKVAIVTGGNRGLGLSIVRKLCQQFTGDVYLTARSTPKGLKAVEALKAEGLNPLFHELDITQPASISMLKEFIQDRYGGVDILINNAAESFDTNTKATPFRQAEILVQTNFKGTRSVCRSFIPMLKPHSRLIIMSNAYIGLQKFMGPEVQAKMESATVYELDRMLDEYVYAVKSDTYSNPPDRVTKVFLVAMAKRLAQDLQGDRRRNILVNACCPGWTMSGASGSYLDESGRCGSAQAKQPDAAAEDVVWLALLPAGTTSPNGELVQYRKIVPFKE
jgi:carbonyl reductase 1